MEENTACLPLRAELASRFSSYLKVPELEDAIDGFVQTETEPDVRKKCILKRFAEVAALLLNCSIWGKESLTDTAWHSPTNATDRFLKVSVEMP